MNMCKTTAFQRRYRYLCSPFILLLLVMSCSRATGEAEPNDSFDHAQKIMPDSEITGYMNTPDDRDFYVFECIEEGRISIELTSMKGINHQLVIYRKLDNGQAELKLIDDSRKSSPEKIPAIGIMPGTYYIEVSHGERDTPKGSNEQKYCLRIHPFVSANSEEEAVEYEPNDLARLATPINSGTPMKGFYSPSFNKLNQREGDKFCEYDYFSFDINASQAGRYLADFTVSGVPGVDSYISLFGPDGFPLNESDTGAIGAGESIVGQGFTEPGTYTLRLSVKNYASNNQTPYVLNFNAAQADSSIEMERNDEITSSNIMRGSSVRGRIYPEGDVDYFAYIPGEDPRFVTVRLVPAEGVNVRFNLYNEQGEKTFEIDNADTGMSEIMPGVFAAGRLFIQVEAFAGELDADKYYTLTVEPTLYQHNMEMEPNDEKDFATFIENGTVYGYTSFAGDRDYYLLEAGDRASAHVRMTGIRGAECSVSITDNLGYVINSYDVRGEEIVEFSELVNRRAYLIIEAKSENYEQPYMIEVEVEEQ